VETIDWLWIVHPALTVVLIDPLIRLVVRFGIQTKARRVDGAWLPPATGQIRALWDDGFLPVLWFYPAWPCA